MEGIQGVRSNWNKSQRELICKTERAYKQGEISKRTRSARFRHQKKRLDELLIDGLAHGTDELADLCDRLWEEMDKLWAFSQYTDVDPTNNLAERDLRRLVLWRKKSYGTRSQRGQYFVERISSLAETVRKAGNNILGFITKAVSAFFSGEGAPFVYPSGNF